MTWPSRKPCSAPPLTERAGSQTVPYAQMTALPFVVASFEPTPHSAFAPGIRASSSGSPFAAKALQVPPAPGG